MALVAAFVAILISAEPGPLNVSVRMGVVAASPPDAYVLAMGGALLAPGTPVTVVDVERRGEVAQATVVKRRAASDVMATHQVPGPFYEVAAEPGSMSLPNLGIAVVGRVKVEGAGDGAVLHFAERRIDLRTRSCSSSEGLHLTLWSGTPLKSQRLWHQYYYLGYDVEPTCTPADVSDRD